MNTQSEYPRKMSKSLDCFDKIKEEFEIYDGFLDYDKIRNLPDFSKPYHKDIPGSNEEWKEMITSSGSFSRILYLGDEITKIRCNKTVDISFRSMGIDVFNIVLKENEEKDFFFPITLCLSYIDVFLDTEDVTLEGFYHHWDNEKRSLLFDIDSNYYSKRYDVFFINGQCFKPTDDQLSIIFQSGGKNIKG